MTQKFNSDMGTLAMTKMDLIEGLKRWKVWSNLAWGEVNARYGRTVFGAAWNIVSFALFCLAIIFIFGALSKSELNIFGPHVVIGFLVYSYISSLLLGGCAVFTSNENWLKSIRLPYGVFIFKSIMLNTIIFLFNLVAALIILAVFFDIKVHAAQWLVIPGFFFILLNSVAVYMFFGVLCARFRDILHLMQTVIRFSLFVTPILWKADDFGVRGELALYNPLTHFIDIIRLPVLYGDPATKNWIIVLSITGCTWILAIVFYASFRKRIIYWL